MLQSDRKNPIRPYTATNTLLVLLMLLLSGCGDDGNEAPDQGDTAVTDTEDTRADLDAMADDGDMADLPLDLEQYDESTIYDFANGCVSLRDAPDNGEAERWLQREDGEHYAFTSDGEAASRFFMKARPYVASRPCSGGALEDVDGGSNCQP